MSHIGFPNKILITHFVRRIKQKNLYKNAIYSAGQIRFYSFENSKVNKHTSNSFSDRTNNFKQIENRTVANFEQLTIKVREIFEESRIVT